MVRIEGLSIVVWDAMRRVPTGVRQRFNPDHPSILAILIINGFGLPSLPAPS